MKLELVKQGDFLGTKCDFYVNGKGEVFMSRTQIGYALKYKQPQHSVLMIHQRHKERLDKFSIEVTGSQFVTPLYKNKGAEKVFMYKERGVYEICRYSSQKIADEFNDWVYNTILSIKENGYYIASEKDNKWLGIRKEGKTVRKTETDSIKAFIEYGKEQGSSNSERYYTIITKLVNNKLGIESSQRDNVSQQTLIDIKTLEGLINMKLKTLVKKKKHYKEIYQDIKNLIESI